MIEGAARSESKDDEEEHSMTFQLGEGEEEEASSLVPLSVDVNGGGRLNRWSLKYLTENSERGVGKIVGGGSFGESKVCYRDFDCFFSVRAVPSGRTVL